MIRVTPRDRPFVVAAILLAVACASSARAQVVIRGERVHTMAGEVIEDGAIVIIDGIIAAVGPFADVTVPAGYEVLRAAVVTPGLVDAHSVVGLAGQYNYDHDQDQLEHSEPLQPELRAVDSYNARERLVEWIRSFGVTTLHTGHAPGAVIAGQTMIVKTRGDTVDDALMVDTAAVAVTLGEGGLRQERKSPGTRSKMMAMLRARLVAAREYRERRARFDDPDADEPADGDKEADGPPARDLGLEVLVRVLDGEVPLLITAHRSQDIANALRLADEFDVRMILDGGSESYLLLDRISAAGIDVIVHPTMMRSWKESENMSFRTASILADAGIRVALQSGYEDYVPKTRVVLFEAAWAAANGMGFDRALGSITIDAARILGVADRVGSLEVGKDGDVALYDGDPFEYTTHCVGVVIDGDVVSREVR